MSRNLLRTTCAFCDGAVQSVEDPRPITQAEAGVYFEQYRTMQVADAACPACGAQYLAWCVPPTRGVHAHQRTDPYADGPFYDLSFRSTFNDEPGEDDMPTVAPPEATEVPSTEPYDLRPCPSCGKARMRDQPCFGATTYQVTCDCESEEWMSPEAAAQAWNRRMCAPAA